MGDLNMSGKLEKIEKLEELMRGHLGLDLVSNPGTSMA